MLAYRLAQRSVAVARRLPSRRFPSALSTTEFTRTITSATTLPEDEDSASHKDSNINVPISFLYQGQYRVSGQHILQTSELPPSYTASSVAGVFQAHHHWQTSSNTIISLGVPPLFASTVRGTFKENESYSMLQRAYFSTGSVKPKATIPKAISLKQSFPQQAQDAILAASKALMNFMMQIPGTTWFYITHPKEFKQKMQGFWEMAKKEAHHYWIGSKLLYADVQTAYKMLTRILQGSALTRRERKQLLRTVSDLFRLVPFSMFILIPFMEFALPFALRLFPNMLPSTFQDSLKAEENMKAELQSRIAMAQFFQE
jgi:LETM1-like protein